jgi:hypothetical protein
MFHTYKTNPPHAPELIYSSESKDQAQDYCDERNAYLASAGIPSSVCFWFVKEHP